MLQTNSITPDTETRPVKQERYINRDLSWLAFNQRVLEEAQNPQHPLLERVRFLGIAANNLDEFHMVQVAALRRQIVAGISLVQADGLMPSEILALIRARADAMLEDMRQVWQSLKEAMSLQGLTVIAADQLNESERAWLDTKFEHDIFPILTPLAISPTHPFPFIPNRGLAVAVKLEAEKMPHDIDGIVRIPVQFGRFIRLPGDLAKFIPIEDVIQQYLTRLFPNFAVTGSGVFRIVRDSDLDVEDLDVEEDAEHLLISFETALQRRRHGEVVRLSASASTPTDLLDFLIEQLGVQRESVHIFNSMIGLSGVIDLVAEAPPELLFKPFTARFPERIRDFGGDCFAAIKSKDLLVHHPYESFDVVVQFILQAAKDPSVVAIKQTLYRTSADSAIVQALIEAAEAGKSVTAVIELKARFDEEANLKWARDLERAGAQITYGFIELKIHAKLSLVVRREATGLVSYIHYGTGNYHPVTAKVYTDLSLFSCNEQLCSDAAKLFNYMTGYAEPEILEKVIVAPIGLRNRLIELIETETKHAAKGKPAEIWFKLNGLVDPEIIECLYAASAAGVKIHGIVRGMCALRAGVKGLSENITIHSIVGRFLEHARIVCFGAGAALPSPQAKVFISSADWMPRNLDHRIETLVPVENETVRQQVLDQVMVANIKDNTQTWQLKPDNTWEKIHLGREPFSAQDYFMSHPSLSGRGTALSGVKPAPRLKFRHK